MSAIVIYENDGTVSYTLGATPSSGPFAIDFPYYFADEITVTKVVGTASTLLAQGADYTLTGVPADDGFWSGSITTVATHHDCTIRIDRTLRTTKATNFPETGSISIPGMNTLFSRLFSWVQDLNRRMSSLIDSVLGQRGQGEGVWKYKGVNAAVDPGNGGFAIQNGTGPARTIALSTTDDNAVVRYLKLMRPGDSLVITSELTPVTAYARYDVVDVLVDHVSWVSFAARLSDQTGFDPGAVVGQRYRLSGFLNTATGMYPLTGVLTDAGSNLQGGGTTGDLHLSIISSPAFTGVPTTTKPAPPTDSSFKIASTNWVNDFVALQQQLNSKLSSEMVLGAPGNALAVAFPADHSKIKRLTVELYAWSQDLSTKQMGFNLTTATGSVVTNNYITNNILSDSTALSLSNFTGTFWTLPTASILRATLEFSFSNGGFNVSGHFAGIRQDGKRTSGVIGLDIPTDTSLVTGFRSTFTDTTNFAAGSYMRVHATSA